eukprot:SAG31_NODE_17413_length_671_cov_1.575175_2_plen_66_part_00
MATVEPDEVAEPVPEHSAILPVPELKEVNAAEAAESISAVTEPDELVCSISKMGVWTAFAAWQCR